MIWLLLAKVLAFVVVVVVLFVITDLIIKGATNSDEKERKK